MHLVIYLEPHDTSVSF